MSSTDKDLPPGELKGYFLVVPPQAEGTDEFDVRGIVSRLWKGRLWIAAFVVGAVAIAAWHAFTAVPVYQSSATIVVRTEGIDGGVSGLRGQLGGLASLAGLSLGGAGDRRSEYIAALKARQIARAFIEERKLMPVLFAGRWDAATGKFRPDDKGRTPTLSDAANYFQQWCKVRDDSKTGLIIVTVEWFDPQVAAEWANGFVEFTNRQLQLEAIRSAEQSVKYLNNEIGRTTVEPVRQSLYRLLESRLNERMIATVQHEYAFKTVDEAVSVQPHQFVRPKRAIEIIIGIFCGLLFGVLFALWRNPAAPADHNIDSN